MTAVRRGEVRAPAAVISSPTVPGMHRPPGVAGDAPDARHFRAIARRPVRLEILIRSVRAGWERPATAIDIGLGGAGVETDAPLAPGERLEVAFSTPTLWDPLVVPAVVAWAAGGLTHERGAPPTRRAGLAFDYASPDEPLAVFEMLAAMER